MKITINGEDFTDTMKNFKLLATSISKPETDVEFRFTKLEEDGYLNIQIANYEYEHIKTILKKDEFSIEKV